MDPIRQANENSFAPAHEQHGQRILVIDDAPEVTSEIYGLLWLQYEVHVVSDGVQALERLKAHPPPDLILLDVVMPELDGYEVCRRVKADPALKEIPVIFLTSRADPQDEAFGLKLGAVDYIAKPVNPAVLRARVNTQIELRVATTALLAHNAMMREEVDRTAQEAKAKTQALLAASHDLRQPVHALGLMVDCLAQAPQARPLATQVAQIRMLVQSLSNSLSVLMSAARLEAGLVQAEPSSINLRGVFEQCQAEYEHTAALQRIKLDIHAAPVRVKADAALVRGILQNLLSNALRYSDGTEIVLDARVDGERVWVSVTDDGQGMDAEKLAQIFNPAKKLSLQDQLRGGTGLGLSIAKSYADLLGSELLFTSKPGAGTSASFSLMTVATGKHHHSENEAAAAPSALLDGQPSVLLFEDDRSVRDATARALSEWGCKVDAQADVLQWWLKPISDATNNFSLVVADHHVHAQVNGLDLIEEARRRCGKPDLPGLLLTGDVSPELEWRCASMQVLLRHKPLRPSELRAAISKLLR